MNQRENRPLVIFGTGELAQLASYYFTHDSQRTVAAFTEDTAFLKIKSLMGLPIVGFENLEETYPPEDYDLFIAIGYTRLNQARTEKYRDAKARGYRLATYISSRCTHYPDLQIGDNCLVMEGNLIQPFVTIGNNVIIWSGNVVSHHVDISSNCFIAAQSVISGNVKIGPDCFIGVNATLRENIVLARQTIIGAGALVLKSTEENQSYLGVASEKSGIPSTRLQSLL
jgi:sugar O-acyltransferase (sialic acid O-acetyltransferase NeuD family)